MKQYPIWIDTHNPNYANQYSKSMGVKNSSSSNIKIGTSAKNSYDFLNTRIEHKQADNGSRVYNFFVDDELIIVGKITYLNNAYKQVEIRGEIKNQNGKKVSRAKIKVGMLGPSHGEENE